MTVTLLLTAFQNMFINMFSTCYHLIMRLPVSLLSHLSQPYLPRLVYQCLKCEESIAISKSCPVKSPFNILILGENLLFSPRINSQRLLTEFSFDSSKSLLWNSYSITSSYLFIFTDNLIFHCQISFSQA